MSGPQRIISLQDLKPQPLVATGGQPPHDGDMEAVKMRLQVVENHLDRLEDRLRAVEVKLGEMSGKLDLLVAKIPSWWQQPAGLIVVLAAIFGLLAAAKKMQLGL